MPYDVRRGYGGCAGYAVVATADGRVVGCHATRAAAERHRTALYANVPDAAAVAGLVVLKRPDDPPVVAWPAGSVRVVRRPLARRRYADQLADLRAEHEVGFAAALDRYFTGQATRVLRRLRRSRDVAQLLPVRVEDALLRGVYVAGVAPLAAAVDGLVADTLAKGRKYSEDQERDEQGRWSDGDGGSGSPDGEEFAADWVDRLTDEESLQLRTYTEVGYSAVNMGLRDGKLDASDPTVATLDAAVARYELPEDTTLYRGIGSSMFVTTGSGGLAKLDLEVGMVLTDRAFVSTTTDKDFALGWARRGQGERAAVLRITVPRGTRAAPIYTVSEHQNEAEVLLGRGSSFRLTGSGTERVGGQDVPVFYAELVASATKRWAVVRVRAAPGDRRRRFVWEAGDVVVERDGDDQERAGTWGRLAGGDRDLILAAEAAIAGAKGVNGGSSRGRTYRKQDDGEVDLAAIVARLAGRVVEINEATRKALQKLIAAGMEQGYSLAQLANGVPEEGFAGVRAFVAETYRNRGAAIARTELAYAQNWVAAARYDQAGVTHVELMDGDGCGFTEHDDPDLADGSLRTLAELDAYPVAHPNCLVAGTQVLAPDVLAAMSREYEGAVVTLRTAGDHQLTCTPDHPVLARRGWIPAGEVEEGDELVDGRRLQALLAQHQDELVPAAVEEVARALREVGGVAAGEVPAATVDLHGDGRDGEVDVVWTDRPLRHDGKPRREGVADQLFELAHAALGLAGGGPPRERGRGVGAPLLGAHGGVLGAHDRGVPWARVSAVQAVAAPPQVGGQALAADAEIAGDLLDGLPGAEALVQFVEVVGVERGILPAGSHVYNLQTGRGWYLAGGVIVHNCVRTPLPVVPVAAQRAWAARVLLRYSDDQERDDGGRWSTGGGGSGDGAAGDVARMVAAMGEATPLGRGEAVGQMPADSNLVVGMLRQDVIMRAWEELPERYQTASAAWLLENNHAGFYKHVVASQLAVRAGVSYEYANAVVHSWAKTANDSSERALEIQQAAAEEFGGELSPWQRDRFADVSPRSDAISAAVAMNNPPIPNARGEHASDRVATRAVLRAMYVDTQARLRDMGVKELVLARGVAADVKSSATTARLVGQNTLESWSLSPYVAATFVGEGTMARNVVYARVPAARVLSYPRTGFGCLNEQEMVILGRPRGDRVRVGSGGARKGTEPVIDLARDGDPELSSDWIKWRSRAADVAAGEAALAAHRQDAVPVVERRGRLHVVKYSDDQPRDESGRWGDGGGGAGSDGGGDEVAVTAAEVSILDVVHPRAVVSLEGVEPFLAQAMADGVVAFAQKYPGAARTIHSVQVVDPDDMKPATQHLWTSTFAMATGLPGGDSKIELNGNYYQDVELLESAMLDAGEVQPGDTVPFHPRTDLTSVLDHELGHVLDYYAGRGMYMSDLDPVLRDPSRAERVSRYATKNAREAFAEAFSVLHVGGTLPDDDLARAAQLVMLAAGTRVQVDKIDRRKAASAAENEPTCAGYIPPEVAARDQVQRRARARRVRAVVRRQ